MTEFVPYRKARPAPYSADEQARRDALVAMTKLVAQHLAEIATAMDVLTLTHGAISLRDCAGDIWELTVQRSDAKTLRCEMPEAKPPRRPRGKGERP